MQKPFPILHKYTETAFILTIIRSAFSEIFLLLCDKPGGEKGANKAPVKEEQQSDS